jgi:hypothetical protein
LFFWCSVRFVFSLGRGFRHRMVRIPTKPAMHSNMKPATRSEMKPAMVPI